MRINLAVPDDVRAEVEARARRAGRSVEREYGRLFVLGMLVELVEQVAPLFPELKDRGRELAPPATTAMQHLDSASIAGFEARDAGSPD